MSAALVLLLACLVPPDGDGTEPAPLATVYRETLRQALHRTWRPAPAGLAAEREFLALVGDRAAPVAHALAGMARSAADGADRRAALRGLALLRRPVDAPVAEAALVLDADVDVRGEAAATLGILGGEVARAALARCVRGEGEADEAVRALAAHALLASRHPAAPAALARSARLELPDAVAQAVRTARTALGLDDREFEALGLDAPAAAPDAAAACVATEAPAPAQLAACCHGGPEAGRALAAALDDAAAPVRARARRCLWLRELALAGVAAARHDAVTAAVPARLAALGAADSEARRAARRWLAWLAGRDLGDAVPPWEAWWRTARAMLRVPAEPPEGNRP